MIDRQFPPLPRRLGVAADMMFMVREPVSFVADHLLVYDQLVIPGDPTAMFKLYAAFGHEQVRRLLKAGRVRFCPAMSRPLGFEASRQGDTEYSRSKYLEQVRTGNPRDWYTKGGILEGALEDVDNYLIVGTRPDYVSWHNKKEEAVTAFDAASMRPGYEFLYPIDPRSGLPMRDRVVGLEMGMARINDLVTVGVGDFEIDAELAFYLNLCFPGSLATPTNLGEAERTKHLVESLYRIKNLPSLGAIVEREEWEPERVVDVVTSDAAGNLRTWLKEHVEPGIDVRDAYSDSLENLPSKHSWTRWIRVGSVAAVTGVVGALVAGPVGAALGTAVGPMLGATVGATVGAASGPVLDAAIGAADELFGDKIAEKLVDDYHPRDWLEIAAEDYRSVAEGHKT